MVHFSGGEGLSVAAGGAGKCRPGRRGNRVCRGVRGSGGSLARVSEGKSLTTEELKRELMASSETCACAKGLQAVPEQSEKRLRQQ